VWYGNHDAVACGRRQGKDFHAAARNAALWARERLSPESREYLAGLPSSLRAEAGAVRVPGSPSDPDRYIYTNDQAMEEMESAGTAVADGPVFFGHTHVAGGFVRRGNGVVEQVPPGKFRLGPGERALLNPGSVGQPRDRDPDASYLVYDPSLREVEWVRCYTSSRPPESVAAGCPLSSPTGGDGT
jgi:diadenosine tetraphosphatase ApaH/serine/threonine PP2A family protein phosphatase